MVNPKHIAILITEDPDIFNEGIDFKILWKYYENIRRHPNADDLITLINMIKSNFQPEQHYNMLSDMLPDIKTDILPRLTEDERNTIVNALSKMNNTDIFKYYMSYHGLRHGMHGRFAFDNPKMFEEALEAIMSSDWPYNTSAANQLLNNNKHLIKLIDIDLVNKFVEFANQQNNKLHSSPSIGEMLRKHIEDAMNQPPEDGI